MDSIDSSDSRSEQRLIGLSANLRFLESLRRKIMLKITYSLI
jgi:hypothetical protein